MKKYKEVEQAIPLIINDIDCFNLVDFKDRGSPCIDWFNLSQQETHELAITKAYVEICMPKNLQLHRSMSKALSKATGSKWVTYDWTVKTVGRILAFSTLEEFSKMLVLSKAVRAGMKQRGLTDIHNIEEAFD